MGSSSTHSVTNTQLQIQLVGIAGRLERIEKDIGEIKDKLMSNDTRVGAIEQAQAGVHPILDARLDALEKRTNKHDDQISELTKNVESLRQTVKVVTWVCGIAGAAVLTWLVAQLLALI